MENNTDWTEERAALVLDVTNTSFNIFLAILKSSEAQESLRCTSNGAVMHGVVSGFAQPYSTDTTLHSSSRCDVEHQLWPRYLSIQGHYCFYGKPLI